MFRRHLFWIALTLAILLIAARGVTAGANAGGVPPLPIVGEIGDNAQAVDVEGDYAYVGFGNEFAIINIFDKEKPSQVGSLIVPSEITIIQIVDNFAFLTNQNELIVVDVSQPEMPIQLDSFSESLINDMKIDGEHAYLLASTYLVIVNIDNPDDIYEVSRYEIEPTISPLKLIIGGNFAFATQFGGFTNGTWVIDISIPETPSEIAYWPQVDGPNTAVRENIFYTAYGNCIMPNVCPAVFVSYDISDLQNPVQKEVVQNGDAFIFDLELDGVYAFTGSRLHMKLFALGQEGDTFLGHQFATDDEIYDLTVGSGYVYLATEAGLQIVFGPPYSPVYLPELTYQPSGDLN